jgi:hypothetical protein
MSAATTNPWTFVQQVDEYTDYDAALPDHGGYGVRLRLTIVERETDGARYGYLTVVVDDAEHWGTDIAESRDVRLPYAVACAMTGHTTPSTRED